MRNDGWCKAVLQLDAKARFNQTKFILKNIIVEDKNILISNLMDAWTIATEHVETKADVTAISRPTVGLDRSRDQNQHS